LKAARLLVRGANGMKGIEASPAATAVSLIGE
jgi:hypothetical protein